MVRDIEFHRVPSYIYVYTVSTNISTKLNRSYVTIWLWFSQPLRNPVLRLGPLRWQPNHWAHRRTSNRRMAISNQGICQWSPGDCFIGTHSRTNCQEIPQIYRVFAEMKTITKTYTTETILNAASANPSHWGDVSHGGQHRNATMLKFCLATSLEVLHASVGRKTCWIPKSDWGLHAEFILECSQRRCRVVGPVSPGASGQTILVHGQRSKAQECSIKIS